MTPINLISGMGKGGVGKWVSNEQSQWTHKCDLLDNSTLGEVLPDWAFGVWSLWALDRPEAQEFRKINQAALWTKQ